MVTGWFVGYQALRFFYIGRMKFASASSPTLLSRVASLPLLNICRFTSLYAKLGSLINCTALTN